MPTIGNLGMLYVRNKDGALEEVPVICGKDGLTPRIGDNGNWWIGDTDTGVLATGEITVRPQVTSGYGTPASSIDAEENDLYVDILTGYIYHYTNNTWSLVGGTGSGGVNFETGEGLKLENGVLSLDAHEITNAELQEIINQVNRG